MSLTSVLDSVTNDVIDWSSLDNTMPPEWLAETGPTVPASATTSSSDVPSQELLALLQREAELQGEVNAMKLKSEHLASQANVSWSLAQGARAQEEANSGNEDGDITPSVKMSSMYSASASASLKEAKQINTELAQVKTELSGVQEQIAKLQAQNAPVTA